MAKIGNVTSVRGSVVDVRFDRNLPAIYSLLHSQDRKIAIEVLSQLDTHHIRGIALTPIQACRWAQRTLGCRTAKVLINSRLSNTLLSYLLQFR